MGHGYVLVTNDKNVKLNFENRIKRPKRVAGRSQKRRKKNLDSMEKTRKPGGSEDEKGIASSGHETETASGSSKESKESLQTAISSVCTEWENQERSR
jgi:hypothetical protein